MFITTSILNLDCGLSEFSHLKNIKKYILCYPKHRIMLKSHSFAERPEDGNYRPFHTARKSCPGLTDPSSNPGNQQDDAGHQQYESYDTPVAL